MQRKVGAVFEAWKARPLLHPRYGVFEPEPSRWEANETDCAKRRVKARTERARRSQDVEVEVQSLASPVAALRVALDEPFVRKLLKRSDSFRSAASDCLDPERLYRVRVLSVTVGRKVDCADRTCALCTEPG